ncbi:unnamed protein product [Adineta ricciae]|uniref:Uncharacterized protein n=1 Tax=Adineta ricciae TaxID=249248 RepID=A0A815Q4S0_ADIRI|nr:unnamed protein product [Adineta ricciae]CAF1492634.1 unnamed protein product [Adineta ricciae]
MALFSRSQFNLRPTSSRATVPDNDLAKLMYYLNCVFSAIEYTDQDVRRYRDYRNWSFLTNAEQRMVLVLALALSPDGFEGKVFFHAEELCGDSGNKFYELSEVRHQLLAVQSIIVAGQTRQVKKIMTYRMSWMRANYVEPVKGLAAYFEQQNRAAAARALSARSARSSYNHSNPSSDACVIS